MKEDVKILDISVLNKRRLGERRNSLAFRQNPTNSKSVSKQWTNPYQMILILPKDFDGFKEILEEK